MYQDVHIHNATRIEDDARVITPAQCRSDIPILKKVTYFDCAATCPTPRPVIDAIIDYWKRYPYNYAPDLAVFAGSAKVKRVCDEARSEAARLINASPSEIVFTKNTTEAINIVANGIRWKRGDEIIISNIEHQSNHIPWLRLVDTKGVKLKIVKSNAEGITNPEVFNKAIGPKTKLIATLHASNVLGSIQDVSAIGKIARQKGILFLVDAAQTAGRLPIDVKEIGCDFMAICGRKSLMGPQGSGLLYGRSDALEALVPSQIGGVAASLVSEDSYQLSDVPHRFHAGIYNAMGIIGLGRGIRYVSKEIGIDRSRKRIRFLTEKLVGGLEGIKGVRIYGPRDLDSQNGVVSFNLEGFDSKDVALRLDKTKSVIVGSGSHGSLSAMKHINATGTVRASLHFFTSEEDIDLLLSSLRRMSGTTK